LRGVKIWSGERKWMRFGYLESLVKRARSGVGGAFCRSQQRKENQHKDGSNLPNII